VTGWLELFASQKIRKIIEIPKEVNAVSTKVLLRRFSSSLPIFPVYFQIVVQRDVLSGCFAHFEHTKWVCNVLVRILCEVTTGKYTVLSCNYKTCLGVTWENIDGKMGRLEVNIAEGLLYWLHSFPLAWLTFSNSQSSLAGTFHRRWSHSLKRRFCGQLREQKVQRKNPGNALRRTKSHLRRKGKD